jgi:hypothetical protein
MPDKPLWYGHLEEAVAQLRSLPHTWVDRATVEQLLGVGRRRAQQILAPCVTCHIGASAVADRDRLIEHLERLAGGETAYYERRRRRRLAMRLEALHRTLVEQPRLLVEAPATIAGQRFESLPTGIAVQPGRITISFGTAREALEKLLALAMAAGNDLDGFERLVDGQSE